MVNLRNKIFTILGILLVIVTIGSYFLFDINIKQNSQAMGSDILIARTNIPEGTIIRSIEEAEKYFAARRITQAEAVPSSVKVKTVKKQDENFLDKIRVSFTPEELDVDREDLAALVNKKITVDIYKNQQVLSVYLSNDTVEFQENERYFAVPTNYIDSVGAEISTDDYVDLWVHYSGGHEQKGTSEKIIEALKVVKVKGANNEEVTNNGGVVPSLVIFKMTEDQIAVVSRKMYEGSLFLTKWGRKPTTKARIVLEEMEEGVEEHYHETEEVVHEPGENDVELEGLDISGETEDDIVEQGDVDNDEQAE